MKRIVKILKSTLSIFFIIALSNNVFALSAGGMRGEADNWLKNGFVNSPITPQEAWDELMPIAQILLAIGSIVLVISFMWLGVKYMTTDPSGKADIKQKLIGLVVATVVIYGGIGIFTVIVNVMNGILA